MVNLDAQRQKIESLNSADHRIIDTITGALLRVFCQLEEQDRALQLHRERLRRLETASAPIGDGPKVAPTTSRQHHRPHKWTKPNVPDPTSKPAAELRQCRGAEPGARAGARAMPMQSGVSQRGMAASTGSSASISAPISSASPSCC